MRRVAAAALVILVWHVVVHVTGHRKLRTSDVNFLHTTDTHGWLGGHRNQAAYDADWGDFVAFAQHMRQKARQNNQDLLLVDSGDRHDGNGLSDASTPAASVSNPIFAAQHYDIITLGNHELYQWENSMQELSEMVPRYGANYVCSNVEAHINGSYVGFGSRYRYFETPVQGRRILSFAFLFDFARANSRTRVTPVKEAIVQDWFTSVLDRYGPEDVDMVVVVGHMPVTRDWAEMAVLHTALRQRYPHTVIQYFGGHSHIRDFSVLDERSTALQSGRFCETVGFLSVDLSPNLALRNRFFRAYLDFSTSSFGFHAGTSAVTRAAAAAKKRLRRAREMLALDTVLGHVHASYYMDYVPISHPRNIYRMLTEQVLPTLQEKGPDAGNRAHRDRNAAPASHSDRPAQSSSSGRSPQRIIIINTGSVRYDLYKGPYTVDTHYIVSPFENDWVKMTLSKDVAIKIAAKLNEQEYIAGLRAPHMQAPPPRGADLTGIGAKLDSVGSKTAASPGLAYFSTIWAAFGSRFPSLSKGYVTHDDFGSDGDDTPHRAVINHPIPNVVQSQELRKEDDSPVDVVFYSFLISSVTWAVQELGADVPEIEFYSDTYLGQMLSQYVGTGQL